MIRQEFLLLADGAESVNGKIYILGGGVERHLAREFPAQLRADVALGVLVGWTETNQSHALAVRVVDEDGVVAAELNGDFQVGRPAGAKAGQDLRVLIAIKGPFPIQKAGGYKVVLAIDGVEQEPPFRFWVEAAPAAASS